jgi:hypothetical protein
VLNGIAGHVDRADVVAEDYCSAAKRGMKLHQELAKPGSLGYSIGDCTNSASALERETAAWRLEDQEMRLAPRNTA